jgi:uncharacterized membrane protein YsdA (DUF1294 family)
MRRTKPLPPCFNVATLPVWAYFLGGLNILTFSAYGWDKLSAIWGWRRLSERLLLALALGGGSVGALLGMWFFHHKVSKGSFQFPLAVILFFQVATIAYFLRP